MTTHEQMTDTTDDTIRETPDANASSDSGIEAAVAAYVELRGRIDAGDAHWLELADFFTDDIVYIDPAWGRVEGIDAVREFIVESMVGLEDWSFPVDFVAIAGHRVVVKWTQILPGTRSDGTNYAQSGVSTLDYAGDGKFNYEEDLLNMTHVIEDIVESGWRPGPGFNAPPANAERNWARRR